MKHYETMYIIKSTLDDAARAQLVEEMHAIITNYGGSITKTDEWGLREFAYEIDGMTKGYYVVVTYESDTEGLNEFTRLMRLNPEVVRVMTINLDEEKANA